MYSENSTDLDLSLLKEQQYPVTVSANQYLSYIRSLVTQRMDQDYVDNTYFEQNILRKIDTLKWIIETPDNCEIILIPSAGSYIEIGELVYGRIVARRIVPGDCMAMVEREVIVDA